MNLIEVAAGTIVLTRILVLFHWSASFDKIIDSVVGEWWHHFYTGFFLVILTSIFIEDNTRRTLGNGIGAGLMIDQAMIPFYWAGSKRFAYWSASGITVVVIAFLIFAALVR